MGGSRQVPRSPPLKHTTVYIQRVAKHWLEKVCFSCKTQMSPNVTHKRCKSDVFKKSLFAIDNKHTFVKRFNLRLFFSLSMNVTTFCNFEMCFIVTSKLTNAQHTFSRMD